MSCVAQSQPVVASRLRQPNWDPLRAVVGDRLVASFMWMQAYVLEDGAEIQAYKHCDTRRYLFLSGDLAAYARTPCDRLVRQRLDFALEAALCGWWLLSGWDEEDLAEIKRCVFAAAERDSHIAPW